MNLVPTSAGSVVAILGAGVHPVVGIVGQSIPEVAMIRAHRIVAVLIQEEVPVINTIPFESRPWDSPINDEGWQEFRVGTCRGQWRATPDSYELLGIKNHTPGNGHFQQAMIWFEQSCIRDKRYLRIREVWNKNLAAKLVKHGFTFAQGDDMVKRFKTT
jgi:hypothetical protein